MWFESSLQSVTKYLLCIVDNLASYSARGRIWHWGLSSGGHKHSSSLRYPEQPGQRFMTLWCWVCFDHCKQNSIPLNWTELLANLTTKIPNIFILILFRESGENIFSPQFWVNLFFKYSLVLMAFQIALQVLWHFCGEQGHHRTFCTLDKKPFHDVIQYNAEPASNNYLTLLRRPLCGLQFHSMFWDSTFVLMYYTVLNWKTFSI